MLLDIRCGNPLTWWLSILHSLFIGGLSLHPRSLNKIEGAPWKRASVRCGGGEVEKKRRHRYGGLTHNSELGFESLLFCIV